jgi:hypothetical protein
MSESIDLSSWCPREFCLAADIMYAVKENKISSVVEHDFDFKTMKIGFNDRSGYVYMYDDDLNQAMLFNGVMRMVDNDGDIYEPKDGKEYHLSMTKDDFHNLFDSNYKTTDDILKVKLQFLETDNDRIKLRWALFDDSYDKFGENTKEYDDKDDFISYFKKLSAKAECHEYGCSSELSGLQEMVDCED